MSTDIFIVACMLTYNEEKFVRYSIGAIYDAVDRIIVIDSFSKDNTIKYIKELDIKNKVIIIERKWNDNYSDARNTYLKFIEENLYKEHPNLWYFRVDADEVYYTDKLSKIKDIINNNPLSRGFRFNFYTFVGSYHTLSKDYSIEDRACLFKYIPDIKYINLRDEMPIIGFNKPLYSHDRGLDEKLGIKKLEGIWYCHFSWTEPDRCFEKFNKDSPRAGRRVMEESEKAEWWRKEFVEREGIEFIHQYPEIFTKLGPIK